MAVLIAGLGYLIVRDLRLPARENPPAATSTPGSAGAVEGAGEEGAELSPIPIPDLDRPYVPPERLPEDVREEARVRVASTVSNLKENWQLYSRWLDLAAYRKNADDNEGAEEIWLYVAEVWPAEPVAFLNLADLYASTLKDYAKAEPYYRKVIALRPDYVPAYRALHDIYRLKWKTDTSAAEDVLLEGLRANPKNVDLMVPLALYYKEEDRYAEARAYLEESLAETEKAGKKELADAIRAEIATLP